MRQKSFCKVLFLTAVFVILMAHCAFAQLTVYEEDFQDTVWDECSMIKESSLLDLELTNVDGVDGQAISVSALNEGTLGSGKFTGMSFVGDLDILDTSNVYVYTQKIKFTGTPDASFNMSFTDGLFHDGYAFYTAAKNGKYVFASSGSAAGMASAKEIGEGWHTLVTRIFYNTAQSKYDFETVVYDEEGVQVWSRLVRGTTIASTANIRKITYLFNGMTTDNAVLIDDAKLYVMKEKGGVTISDGQTDVPRNCEIEAAFLTAVDTSKISVKDENNETVEGFNIIKTSPYTVKIVSSELLQKNGQYTIVFDDSFEMENVTFITGATYVLDAVCSGEVNGEDRKNLAVNYRFNESCGIEKINCRMMGILYEDGRMVDAAMTDIISAEANVNTDLTAELVFSKSIGENTTISIVFFENGAYIPMSTGITLD